MKNFLAIAVALIGLSACESTDLGFDAPKPGTYETAFCSPNGGVEQIASPSYMGGMFPTVCKNGVWTRFASVN